MPLKHINNKQGCPICRYKNKKHKNNITTENFIKRAKEVHGDKYDYSKVEYINAKNKVCIICPIHGEFWQTPSNHIHKTKPQGCPVCNESKLEKEINDFLLENNIQFERQKRFEWLGKQSLDFYLHQYNIAIECQGKQHFEPIDFGGKGKEWANNLFNKTKELDNNKKLLCLNNKINILYYSNIKNENIITNKNELLKHIVNGK